MDVAIPALPGTATGAKWLFRDGTGFAFFGRDAFVRVAADGSLLGSQPYPLRSTGDGTRVDLFDVTRGATSYVARVLDQQQEWNKLCFWPLEGPPQTLAGCRYFDIVGGPKIVWDGQHYQAFVADGLTKMLRVLTYAETGALVDSRELWLTESAHVISVVATDTHFVVLMAEPTIIGCTPTSLWLHRVSRDLDVTGALHVELLPVPFVPASGSALSLASDGSVYAVSAGDCTHDLPASCPAGGLWPDMTFYSRLAADGSVAPASFPLPLVPSFSDRMVASGAGFARLQTYPILAMQTFDADGLPMASVDPLPVDFADLEMGSYGIGESAAMISVAPDEYVIVYGNTKPEHRLARIVLAAQPR